ncbi:hypothetical protein KC19_10G061900 [Ceratodon purpureus]|uniref:Uncharacterized protein n=1 Tax=Ceratodon purpureus TaxID=3225 RepID=A0A8T0GKX7_CERPU|nr:hypothetical protein KC19_10G061900 [Ceratodon purpureus]
MANFGSDGLGEKGLDRRLRHSSFSFVLALCSLGFLCRIVLARVSVSHCARSSSLIVLGFCDCAQVVGVSFGTLGFWLGLCSGFEFCARVLGLRSGFEFCARVLGLRSGFEFCARVLGLRSGRWGFCVR